MSTITLPVGANVDVQVIARSGLNSLNLALDLPDDVPVCTGCGLNDSADVGTYPSGTELVLEMTDASCSQSYLSTGSHAQIQPLSGFQWAIFWDDAGGGCSPDADFNDMVTSVTLSGPAVPAEQILGAGSILHAINPTNSEAEPVNTATGSYYTSVTDLALPGIGVPLTFTRFYNSADSSVGVLGTGWRHPYQASLEIAGNGDVMLHAEDGQGVAFTKQVDDSFEPAPGVLDTLVQNVDDTYTLTRRDQTAYTFDTTGLLTTLEDRNGQGLSFAHNSGELTMITDSVGREIDLGYTAGLLTSVTLPDDREVVYAYTDELLTSVTDARGGTTTYTYTDDDLLETVTDQNAHVAVTNVYDANGRVIEQTDARNDTSTFDWDPDTQTSTFSDARGNEWIDHYFNGVLISQEDPSGALTTYAYDEDLNLTSITDADGNTTTFTYDEAGNVLTRTDAEGGETTWTYDAQNSVTSVTDPLENETTYDYDGAGNLIEMSQPGALVTTYDWDVGGTGLLDAVIDPEEHTTSFDYDSDGNLASITDGEGNETTMDYDGSGRMTLRVDPRGNDGVNDPEDFTWTFTYDEADHLLTETDPLGNETSFAYDDAGNLVSRTDANEHTTAWAYNEVNNLLSVTAPDQSVTAYTYDSSNNLNSRTDANDHTWIYFYDDANRLASTDSPEGRAWEYEYTPAGRLAAKILPSTDEILYDYDGAGRLTSVDYSRSVTPDVSFEYDAVGNRTEMNDGAGTVTYNYDDLSRLTSVTRGSDAISYAYDDVGNVTSRSYPGSLTTTYTYDDANRMASVTAGGRTTTYGYDEIGNVTGINYPSSTGYVSERTYDESGRLTGIVNEDPGTTVASSFDYTLDPVGNLTQVVTDTETITYDYDELDRLTDVCYVSGCSGSGLAGISYTYDDVGNRLNQVRHSTSNTTTNYTYNDDDQLIQVGNQTWAYDDNGNLITRGNRTLTYDLENRLLTSVLNSTHTYTYDGDGNRLTDSTGTAANDFRYVWDPNSALPQVAIERDGTGAFLRNYVYGMGRLAQSTNSTNAFYYLTDSIGSTANQIRHNGDIKWTYTYEPFGTERSATSTAGAPNNFMRFAGERIDPNGDYYNLRARMYDPSVGRFFQEDPVEQGVSNPFVASYVFVSNRPTVFIDPSGEAATSPSGPYGCQAIPNATVFQYLLGGACPPPGFPYTPLLILSVSGPRAGDPEGECSGPVFPVAGWACLVHDYGYDLVRFGAITNKNDIDNLFYSDYVSSCDDAYSSWWEGPMKWSCHRAANLAFLAVFSLGRPEPGQPI